VRNGLQAVGVRRFVVQVLMAFARPRRRLRLKTSRVNLVYPQEFKYLLNIIEMMNLVAGIILLVINLTTWEFLPSEDELIFMPPDANDAGFAVSSIIAMNALA
jgi:hypothetical protein